MRYKPEVMPDPMRGDLAEDVTEWVARASGSTDLRTLLAALERRWWADPVIVCPITRWRLPDRLLAEIRERITAIVHDEFDGHWHHQAIVVRSDARGSGPSWAARSPWRSCCRDPRSRHARRLRPDDRLAPVPRARDRGVVRGAGPRPDEWDRAKREGGG